jgi:long-chain acyl-CoA synthetase
MSDSTAPVVSVRPDDVARIDRAHRCDTRPDLDQSLPHKNVGSMWRHLAATRGDAPWMTYYPCAADVETSEPYTFAQFADLIARVAGMLRDNYHVGPGDAVATLTKNQPVTVAIYFATWSLGARLVPVNPAESDDRVGYIVTNSAARVLIAHDSLADRFAAIDALLPESTQRAVLTNDGSASAAGRTIGTGGQAASGTGTSAAPEGWTDFNAMLTARKIGIDLPTDVSWEAEALVVYTSGTTGNPKGVVLTQRQMFADAFAISRWHGIDASTRMMLVLPIHHVNGTVVTLLTPATVGASVVMNNRFRAKGFWRKVAKHEVNICSVVPTLLQFLLEAAPPADAPVDSEAACRSSTADPLRPAHIPAAWINDHDEFDPAALTHFSHFICGAGPLVVELARDFQERFGVRILHGYGLSETTCYSCFLPTEIPWHVHCRWMYDEGFPSIGCPVETNDMAIHDAEGRPAPPGTRGEIVIRGHNVMKCYHGNPEANAAAFAHDWFRSGDEGFMLRGDDGRDYYFITGRIKELIIRGGVNISPFEIDEVLCRCPGVRVGLAVGFENRYYGEEVAAYCQREEGSTVTDQQVMEHCQKHLPSSKCPKVVLFGDDIPVTSTGKFQRGKLKPKFTAWKDTQFRG